MVSVYRVGRLLVTLPLHREEPDFLQPELAAQREGPLCSVGAGQRVEACFARRRVGNRLHSICRCPDRRGCKQAGGQHGSTESG